MMKTTIALLISLLLSVGFVAAQAMPVPRPVYGQVVLDGVSTPDIDIEVKNQFNGAVLKLRTDEGGGYSFDASDLDAFPGVWLEFKSCEGLDACRKVVKLGNEPLRVDLVVGGDLVKEIEVVKEKIITTEQEIKDVEERIVTVKDEREINDLKNRNSELVQRLADLNVQLADLKDQMRSLGVSYNGLKTNIYAVYVIGGLAFITGLVAIWRKWTSQGKGARAKKAQRTVLDKASADKYKPKG